MIRTYKDLDVYKLAYEVAMEIFWLTREFPTEEIYSLTSQIIRSSRSVSANITEGWAKREYENLFKQHLVHALGSNAETEHWLTYAVDCTYITGETAEDLFEKIDHIGKMLTNLHQKWQSFT